MTPNPSSGHPIQPLNVGNVVSAGFRLYFSHFQQYLGIAALATLWTLLPIVLIFITGLIVFTQNAWPFLGLLVPLWIAVAVYGAAKYAGNAAAIARLAFGELVNQPESSQQARRYTQGRMWSLLLVGVLVFLIFFGISMVLYLALIILAVIAILAIGGGALAQSSGPEAIGQVLANNPAVFLLMLLLFLVILIAAIAFVVWLSARFSIVDMPIAIETGVGATQSLGRGWTLTSRSAWRIVLILIVTSLATFPFQLVVQIISSLLQVFFTQWFPADSPSLLFFSTLGSYMIGFLAGIILLPLWQSIKAVIYYDLRSRREGLGLELRDAPPQSF
jgi:hypothetical protein